LGLAPLLARRCKLIVVSDAGYDPDHAFADLLKLYRTARSRYGTQFVDLSTQRPMSLKDLHLEFKSLQDAGKRGTSKYGVTKKHFLVVGIKYHLPKTVVDGMELPEPDTGVLIYVKPSIVGDEEIDLLQHREENPMFPHDPTSDVAFNELQFESYRQLGHLIGMELCSGVKGDEFWKLDGVNRCDTLTSRLVGRGPAIQDVSDWIEKNALAAENFQDALQMMASGDDDVVCTIAKWAGQSDKVNKASCAEWCAAVEKLLGVKADSWSWPTKVAIREMLSILGLGNREQKATRKSSASEQ